jgi:hypothetical protein
MLNPDCPIVGLLNELVDMYNNGNNSALDMALQIANESLAPRKANFSEKLLSFFNKVNHNSL